MNPSAGQSSGMVVLRSPRKKSRKKVFFLLARPLRGEGGGKALVAGPLKKTFFAASLKTKVAPDLF